MSKEKNGLHLTADIRKWYSSLGLKFFEDLNIQEGQVVLDFGCRVGNYTIPVAESVGIEGKVYALDVNHEAVDEAMKRAKAFSLENIIPMKTHGELEIELPNESVDVILFYDVIRSLCKDKGLQPFLILLKEFYRILKPGGILTILFEHVSSLEFTIEDVIKEITKKLTFAGTLEKQSLMHWNHLEEGTIYIFKKTTK